MSTDTLVPWTVTACPLGAQSCAHVTCWVERCAKPGRKSRNFLTLPPGVRVPYSIATNHRNVSLI